MRDLSGLLISVKAVNYHMCSLYNFYDEIPSELRLAPIMCTMVRPLQPAECQSQRIANNITRCAFIYAEYFSHNTKSEWKRTGFVDGMK